MELKDPDKNSPVSSVVIGSSALRKKTRHHFDYISDDYYAIVAATPSLYGYYHQEELKILKRIFSNSVLESSKKDSNEPRVLDIGCATGRVLQCLRQERSGPVFLGMDLSSKMARIANAGSDADTGFIVGDITNLPFQDKSFDFVYSLEVLEHIVDKKFRIPLALREILRITREGGSLAVESTSTTHHHIRMVVGKIFPSLGTRGCIDEIPQEFRKIYLENPVPVAEPSSVYSILRILENLAISNVSVFWIRAIPEQLFLLMRNESGKRILMRADEALSRLPMIKLLGREFIVFMERIEHH